ncbi:hypothetical protein C0V75_03690 [Tabrizicola sp. TH137]|uniref:HPP family protein n=1 Tax=Tabrizicola sp. TH137 TaxID=2067452 RepID=UPI000C7B370C|nr:HPP family protein [Tabrizicola sp. TH137]PLL14542.1 hypothetical protein C0V75_03690 [Tabrizicola sp. TH137]
MFNRLRPFGPAMPSPAWREALRAACGAGVGLLACEALLWLVTPGAASGPVLLIAPFGASAFLIFVVPNSPLAQPWSVVAGNSVAALAALGTVALLPDPRLAAPLAVALAVLLMAALRALHPPGGAVALATVLAAGDPAFPGLAFAALPVAAGSLGLVLAGLLWNRATGRAYPFRQPATSSAHGTRDAAPDHRLGLPPEALAALLDRLRMGPNIGLGDLTRVLDAAEAEAAARHLQGLRAAGVMSRDLVTVPPDATATTLAQLFRRHGFKTLPILEDGLYRGLVDQSALLGLTDPAATAASLARPVTPLPPEAEAADLIDRLADGRQQAVPITEDRRLVGLVTHSDLIALLAARLRGG